MHDGCRSSAQARHSRTYSRGTSCAAVHAELALKFGGDKVFQCHGGLGAQGKRDVLKRIQDGRQTTRDPPRDLPGDHQGIRRDYSECFFLQNFKTIFYLQTTFKLSSSQLVISLEIYDFLEISMISPQGPNLIFNLT